jgi:hypothetical protein
MSAPSERERKALGGLIPTEAGTWTFVDEFNRVTWPNGSVTRTSDMAIVWDPTGEVERMRRQITITVTELESARPSVAAVETPKNPAATDMFLCPDCAQWCVKGHSHG